MTKKQCPLGEDCDLTIAWMAGAARSKDRIMELEAKLAKAVESLGRISEGESWQANEARDTLAELTGGKDE